MCRLDNRHPPMPGACAKVPQKMLVQSQHQSMGQTVVVVVVDVVVAFVVVVGCLVACLFV